MQRYKSIFITLLLISCNSEISQPTSLPLAKEYLLDEIDLVPEGIDYSKKNDAFYLTSVGKFKIVKVDRKTGEQSDFINEHEFGYTPGAGLLIDDERNELHALGGYYMIKDSLSSLFTFDLTTGELLAKHDVIDEGEHFLNDLTTDKEGNIFLTDSKASAIYILKKESKRLDLFFKSDEIEFPNGIAISEDNSKLFIASIPKGIRVLDLATKEILNESDTLGISQGIDGLEFHKGSLYGVQNSVGANSFNFRKLILNDTQNQIVRAEVIDSHTPKLDIPLTFCIKDNEAIVIGNSNLQYLNQKTFEFSKSDTIRKTELITYTID